jgi:hypothetical protein
MFIVVLKACALVADLSQDEPSAHHHTQLLQDAVILVLPHISQSRVASLQVSRLTFCNIFRATCQMSHPSHVVHRLICIVHHSNLRQYYCT